MGPWRTIVCVCLTVPQENELAAPTFTRIRVYIAHGRSRVHDTFNTRLTATDGGQESGAEARVVRLDTSSNQHRASVLRCWRIDMKEQRP